MYKKIAKTLVGNNILKFIIIIFCISISLSGFLINANLIKNIKTLIGQEVKPSLGGDIKIDSKIKLDKEQINYLKKLEENKKIILSKKFETQTTIKDNSGEPSLVSLSFVDDKYPLYGKLEITKLAEDGVLITKELRRNFLKEEKIEIFGKKYPVSGIIKDTPEVSLDIFNSGKKIFLDIGEFEKLNIDQLGSRIDRDYLIKVINPDDFKNILKNLKESKLFEKTRIRDYERGGERYREILGELNKFINYVLIISFILSIIIIFLVVESFYIGNKKNISILRILGMKNKNLIVFNVVLFSLAMILGFLLSIVLGEISFYFIKKFEISKNFYIYPETIIRTFILGFIILAISVVLPIFKLLSSTALSGLKENFLQVYSKKEIIVEGIIVVLGIFIIYNLVIGGFYNSLFFTIILFLAIVFIAFIIHLILRKTYKYLSFLKNKNFLIYDSIRSTISPGNLSILISFSFIISFSSLLFISILSTNFIERLNTDFKQKNNLFVLNIRQEDLKNIEDKYEIYSIIPGRISKINGIDIKKAVKSGRFTREFQITDKNLKDRILSGNPIKSGEVSVQEHFSKDLRIKIGDEIEFLIYGKKIALKVVNLRENNEGFDQAYFYFQVYKEDFKKYPKTHFLSTFVPKDKVKNFKNEFLKLTGNHIIFVELDKIIEEIKKVSKKIFLIIQVLFVYILVFCIIVVIISVSFLIPFKKNKSKLYNILGAKQKFIKNNTIFEYMYLKILSLIISITVASLSSYYVISKSGVIEFSIKNYLNSLLILALIIIFFAILIKFLVLKITKNLSRKI